MYDKNKFVHLRSWCGQGGRCGQVSAFRLEGSSVLRSQERMLAAVHSASFSEGRSDTCPCGRQCQPPISVGQGEARAGNRTQSCVQPQSFMSKLSCEFLGQENRGESVWWYRTIILAFGRLRHINLFILVWTTCRV